jgi:hypothetical protein
MAGCTHPKEEIDREQVGLCLLCGQRRQYDSEGGNKPPVIISPGIDFTTCNPLELPRERKIAIAHYAKEHDIKHTVKCTGLPMVYIRAWTGAPGRLSGGPVPGCVT